MPYNVNPNPLPGQGVFGTVPGTTDLPNPAGDLAGQIPGLADTNKSAIGAINAGLAGSISPATMHALQNAAATFGARSGMPGLPANGLAMNNLFGNIAGFAENRSQQALQDYNQLIPTISRTQTVDPALQARIAESNAVNRAAPDPAAAGSHAEQLFNQYLNSLRGGGGPGGGTRGGGGGGSTDALGFPVDRFMSGGAGAGPGEVAGNSFGTEISRTGGWGLGNASTPFGSGSGALPWQTGVAGGQPWAGNDILSSGTPWDQFGTQFGGVTPTDPWNQYGEGDSNNLSGGGGNLPDFFTDEYL